MVSMNGTALPCPRCFGTGTLIVAGPNDRACTSCHGTGVAKCHSCPATATVPDLYTDGDGPACSDCATACVYCHAIATQLVAVTDDQGDCERDEAMCDRCADEESERAARIKRVARAAAEAGVDAWPLAGEAA